MTPDRCPITIIYTNGVKVHAEAEEFSFVIDGGGRNFKWKNMHPKPLLLGINEIMAVYEGEA